MRISVALCTYNGATYLGEQLESLLHQEHQPFELIVCDDQSTDRTWEILEEFAQRAPFPVSLHRNEERLRSTRNFEKAMRLCAGDAVALCDQDDIWYPQKLARLSAALNEPGVAGVFSDGDLLRENGTADGSLWHSFGLEGEELATFQHSDPLGVMIRANRVTGMTLMLRREALAYALPIPADWVHDYWIGLMLLLHGRLLALPEALVAYRIHGAQQLSVPKGFVAEVKRRGVRAVFGELSRRANEENTRSLVQLDELLQRLRLQPVAPVAPSVAAASAAIENFMRYLRLRIEIQQWSAFRRATAIAKNWGAYQLYAPRAARDRLVDLLAVQLSGD